MITFRPTQQQYAVCADINGDVQITLFDDWAMADDHRAYLTRFASANWIDIIDFTDGEVIATSGTRPEDRDNPSPFVLVDGWGRTLLKQGCDDDCRGGDCGCEG